MADERHIFEYFVIAGLPEKPEELTPGAAECGYKNVSSKPPITDICIIFPTFQEEVPEGFVMIDTTPSGFPADLNHGTIRTPQCFLCYRRGYHKPPLLDIGVLFDGKEKVMVDSHILQTTPYGRPANVSNTSQAIYLTYRRALESSNPSLLAVTDICVTFENKGETAPHTFCRINKNLNKGIMGSEVYICYKKSLSSANNIAYHPSILDRFPQEDDPKVPLPPNISIFCLPMGSMIQCWPAKCQSPARQFSTFVLTDDRGLKFYGAAVTFWEPYERQLTVEQLEKLEVNTENKSGSCSDNSSTNDPAEQRVFYTNKCICLISRYPFFTAFKRYLFYLYRMSVTGSYPVPIERYISHLMFEVPFPTSRRPRVLVQLGNETISFDNPEDSPLPISGASYTDFLKHLGADNCMYVLLLALTEQKLLLHSLRPAILTSVAEAVTSLLFPCRWQCPYIPQCPLDLAGVLHAPLPFIAGVDSRYFEMYDDPPRDVTCVDLDTSTLSQSEIRKTLKLSLLPKRPTRVLKQTLEVLHRKTHQQDWNVTIMRKSQEITPLEVDYKMARRKRQLELEIQEAFLRFMAAILKGYQHYLKPIKSAPGIGSTDSNALFDIAGFLRSRDKSAHEFYKMFVNTQLFIRFIEERSFLIDNDTFLAVFDEVSEKVDPHSDKMEPRILDYESSLTNDHTLFIPPPEAPHRGTNGTAVIAAAEDAEKEQQGAAPDEAGVVVVAEDFCYHGFPHKLNPEWFFLNDLVLAGKDFEDTGSGGSFPRDRPGSIRSKISAAGRIASNVPAYLRGDSQASNLSVLGGPLLRDSPAVRRTKQEAKSAMKLARQAANTPIGWAKCLLSYAYSVWFIHLSSYIAWHSSKKKAVGIAFQILDKLQGSRLPVQDEVCYRIMIQLCFQYSLPLAAVKAFIEMKRQGIQPNAITYGFYNRAVLEAKWPSLKTLNAQRYWINIRNVIRATVLFRKAGHERFRRLQGRVLRRPLSEYSVTSIESDGLLSQNLVASSSAGTRFGSGLAASAPEASIYSGTTRQIDASVDNDNLSTCSTVISYDAQISSVASSKDMLPGIEEHQGDNTPPATAFVKASRNRPQLGSGSDRGYASQTTENSLLSIPENHLTAERESIADADAKTSGDAEPESGDRKATQQTVSLEEEFEIFDNFVMRSNSSSFGGCLILRSQSTSKSHLSGVKRENHHERLHSFPNSYGSITVDSSAGLLMTSFAAANKSASCLDDSVFEQSTTSSGFSSGQQTCSSIRRRREPSTTTAAIKQRHTAPPTSHSKQQEDASTAVLQEVKPKHEAAKPVDAAAASTDVVSTSAEDDSASISSPRQLSPSKAQRTSVTDIDPLGALVADPSPPALSVYAATATSQSPSPIRAQSVTRVAEARASSTPSPLTLDHPPLFQDDHWTEGDAKNTSTPASAGGMRGFFSRFQTPVSNLIRSRTADAGIDSSPLLSTGSGTEPGTPAGTSTDGYSAASANNNNSSTPTMMSGFTASLQSKVALLKNKESYHRLKHRMSSVVTEFNKVKGNIDQMSSPLKQSLTSLSMDMALGDTVGGVPPLSMMGAGGFIPTTATLSSLVGGLPSSASIGTEREEVLSVDGSFSFQEDDELQENDPAFQLSAGGDIGSLLSFDISMPSAFQMATMDRTPSSVAGSQCELFTGLPNNCSSNTVEGIEVSLCVATKCAHCKAFAYDEEIMAGWAPDDHDLNTKCQFCERKFVPILTAQMRSAVVTVPVIPHPYMHGSSGNLQTSGRKALFSLRANLVAAGGTPVAQQRLFSSRSLSTSSQSIQSVPGNLASSATKECKRGPYEEVGQESNIRSRTPEQQGCSHSAENLLMPPPSKDFTPKKPPKAKPKASAAAASGRSNPQSDRAASLDHIDSDKAPLLQQTSGDDSPYVSNASLNRKLFAACETTAEKSSSEKPTGSVRDADEASCRKPAVEDDLIITVPFLSPLVLRKELENVVAQEGDDCMGHLAFLQVHSILFWNLLYCFQRLCAPTHLKGWLKAAYALAKAESDHRELSHEELRHFDAEFTGHKFAQQHVVVRCVYDMPKLHADDRAAAIGLPLFCQWDAATCGGTTQFIDGGQMSASNSSLARRDQQEGRQRDLVSALLIETRQMQKSTLQQIADHLKVSNLLKALQLLVNEYRKTNVRQLAYSPVGSRHSSASPSRTLTHSDQNSPTSANQDSPAMTSSCRGLGHMISIPAHRSVYRELLFLSIKAYGNVLLRDNFDREFAKAYFKLPPRILTMLQTNDRPPTPVVRACRKIYAPLEV